MNHLVCLDARAGELEKILSGVKTMLIKENDPRQPTSYPVNPGDHLYFLRGHEDCVVRVKATVVRALFITKQGEEDLAHTLKAMQPRLHLTEEQYNDWMGKQQIVLIEFDLAHKIDLFQVDSNTVKDQSDWVSFEKFRLIVE